MEGTTDGYWVGEFGEFQWMEWTGKGTDDTNFTLLFYNLNTLSNTVRPCNEEAEIHKNHIFLKIVSGFLN